MSPYLGAEDLEFPQTLPLPKPTTDVVTAKTDLQTYGVCVLVDVLSVADVSVLRQKLESQATAERALGELAPKGMVGTKQFVPNMVNKGKAFLDLVEQPATTELVSHLLGKHFLLSSINGHVFLGRTHEPQSLHRDQGQVPPSIAMPVVCNLLWVLADFVAAGDDRPCRAPSRPSTRATASSGSTTPRRAATLRAAATSTAPPCWCPAAIAGRRHIRVRHPTRGWPCRSRCLLAEFWGSTAASGTAPVRTSMVLPVGP